MSLRPHISFDLVPVALLSLALCGAPGCGTRAPTDVGLGPLAPCPDTPNCVSSMAPPSSSAWVAPFEITVGPETAWATLHEVLLGWPRLEIVAESDTALHAVERSMLLRFRDDLELRLHASGGRIEVRSASRVGRSDFGVNRRRVERLRQALIERGVVRPAGVGTPSEARVES